MIPEFLLPLDILGLCLSLVQALVGQKADSELVCAHQCVRVLMCAHATVVTTVWG